MTVVDDTIVAIASPTAPGPRGIVRISGDATPRILSNAGLDLPAGASATRTSQSMDLGQPLGVIPVDVVLWPTRRSYTGAPSAELHTLGSLPILARLTERMIECGARAARPGEFTLRAFLAGRLDLTQAEAVLGVIDAETRGSLDAALRQLAGNLSAPLEQLRSDLLNLLADIEAGLDFVDEHIEFVSDDAILERLAVAETLLHSAQTALVDRRDARTVTIVALRGEPNVGKSRLLNALTRSEAAIVSDVAGTTRDAVTLDLEQSDLTIRLVDTAGIEEQEHAISRFSQDQAERAVAEADVRLWCFDLSRGDLADQFNQLMHRKKTARENRLNLWVGTKVDQLDSSRRRRAVEFLEASSVEEYVLTSSLSGEGIEALGHRLFAEAAKRQDTESGSVLGTSLRCSDSLKNASESIAIAKRYLISGDGHEFVAGELRIAIEAMGEVTGAVYTDDILDRVFSRFCIGK